MCAQLVGRPQVVACCLLGGSFKHGWHAFVHNVAVSCFPQMIVSHSLRVTLGSSVPHIACCRKRDQIVCLQDLAVLVSHKRLSNETPRQVVHNQGSPVDSDLALCVQCNRASNELQVGVAIAAWLGPSCGTFEIASVTPYASQMTLAP